MVPGARIAAIPGPWECLFSIVFKAFLDVYFLFSGMHVSARCFKGFRGPGID